MYLPNLLDNLFVEPKGLVFCRLVAKPSLEVLRGTYLKYVLVTCWFSMSVSVIKYKINL